MEKSRTFKMRISPQERQALAELARRLHCTDSDAVRHAVRAVLEAMKTEQPAAEQAAT